MIKSIDHLSLALPMFDAHADLWDGLDETTQEQVMDCLGLLLLRHLQQAACCIPQERTPTKGTPQ
jgi:hypothetical protein